MVAVSLMLFIFGVALNLCMLACLSLDLMITLRWPFAVKENRVNIMIFASFVVSIVITIENYCRFWKDNWSVYTLVGVSYFTFVVSITYAVFKICKTGMSKRAVKSIALRHILTGITLCLTFDYVLFIYMMKENDSRVKSMSEWERCFFKLAFTLQGFIFSLIRLTEPQFYQILFQELK